MSKFKVGDKVRRVNCPNSFSGVGDEESWVLPVGHVDTVSAVEGGGIRLAGYPQKTAVHWPEHFELVAEPKFKVGYKVKIMKKDWTFGWNGVMARLVGTELLVDDYYEGAKKGYQVGGYVWSEESLELVEEPKLKVGDRVRVKPGDYHGYYFSGDVGTVVEHPYKNTNYSLVYVRFSGHHNAKVCDEGYWWVEPTRLDKLPVHYSSKFTDPAKAEPTTGHAPDSGLQKHSIGELYPLAVVGYGDSPMIFVLENLETGQVAGDGEGDYVRQWYNADHVVEFANKHGLTKEPLGKVDDWGDAIVWFTGRPINVNGHLEMPKITRKVQF